MNNKYMYVAFDVIDGRYNKHMTNEERYKHWFTELAICEVMAKGKLQKEATMVMNRIRKYERNNN